MNIEERRSETNNERNNMKYRKKPVVIEAVQFLQGNFSAIIAAFPEAVKWNGWLHEDGKWRADIPTMEGTMTATDGDWIIKGVKGEFYPCKPDIFEATYEPEHILANDKAQL